MRAPAAREGGKLVSVTLLTVPAATTSSRRGVDARGSDVVATATRAWPTVVVLVTPVTVMRTRAPGATLSSGSRKHSIARPTGLKQPPTSVVPTRTSLVVPPVNVVPVGKPIVIRLLAALDMPPLAEAVNSTT